MATRGRPPHPDILTPRQWEVLDLVRQGLSNLEIAERLDITLAAVKFHVSEILGKLSLSSREEAAAWDPRQRPDWTPRWDPTRRPVWATALAPLGLFWRRLTGGVAHSAGSLATVTSVGLGVALVAGITIFAVAVMRTRGSSNDASDTPPAVVAHASATPPAVVGQSTATGKIAFLSRRDGNQEIYVMNADGSGQTNVSNGPSDDSFGGWSPDGSRIAFISDRDGNQDIYVVNADGSGLTNLSNNRGDDSSLDASFGAWSPDGSRIAFTSGINVNLGVAFSDRDGNQEVYVVNADGSGLTNLTNDPSDDGFGAWSPDGSGIAFNSNRDGNPFLQYGGTIVGGDIYVMNADGSGQTRLTNNPATDLFSAWSPDGSRIAFTSDRDDRDRSFEIYVMNADGSGQTNLTSSIIAFGLAWSPDGSRIAFQGPDNRGSQYHREIYVMNADGSGQTNLTNGSGGIDPGWWSPDGSRIAFLSDRDGNWEIYVVNADGSGQTRITNDPALDLGPAWSPDGSRIAFTSGRGNFDIYVRNADGSGLTNLTNNPGEDSAPVWSPAR